MSDQNVQVVQGAYAAFGRGDVQGLLDVVSDDVDWHGVNGADSLIPWGTRVTDKAGVASFFKELDAACEFQTFEPREFFSQGDKVVALGYYLGRSKETGRTFSSEWAMVFTVRNGKVTKFREYTDSFGVVSAFNTVTV